MRCLPWGLVLILRLGRSSDLTIGTRCRIRTSLTVQEIQEVIQAWERVILESPFPLQLGVSIEFVRNQVAHEEIPVLRGKTKSFHRPETLAGSINQRTEGFGRAGERGSLMEEAVKMGSGQLPLVFKTFGQG